MDGRGDSKGEPGQVSTGLLLEGTALQLCCESCCCCCCNMVTPMAMASGRAEGAAAGVGRVLCCSCCSRLYCSWSCFCFLSSSWCRCSSCWADFLGLESLESLLSAVGRAGRAGSGGGTGPHSTAFDGDAHKATDKKRKRNKKERGGPDPLSSHAKQQKTRKPNLKKAKNQLERQCSSNGVPVHWARSWNT